MRRVDQTWSRHPRMGEAAEFISPVTAQPICRHHPHCSTRESNPAVDRDVHTDLSLDIVTPAAAEVVSLSEALA